MELGKGKKRPDQLIAALIWKNSQEQKSCVFPLPKQIPLDDHLSLEINKGHFLTR